MDMQVSIQKHHVVYVSKDLEDKIYMNYHGDNDFVSISDVYDFYTFYAMEYAELAGEDGQPSYFTLLTSFSDTGEYWHALYAAYLPPTQSDIEHIMRNLDEYALKFKAWKEDNTNG